MKFTFALAPAENIARIEQQSKKLFCAFGLQFNLFNNYKIIVSGHNN